MRGILKTGGAVFWGAAPRPRTRNESTSESDKIERAALIRRPQPRCHRRAGDGAKGTEALANWRAATVAPQRVCPNLPFAFKRKETGEASAVRSQVFSSHGLPSSLARSARTAPAAWSRPKAGQRTQRTTPSSEDRERDGAGPRVWFSATTCSARSRDIRGSRPNRSALRQPRAR